MNTIFFPLKAKKKKKKNSFQSKATKSLSVVNMAHSGFKQLMSVQNSLSFLFPSSPWRGSKLPGRFCVILALQAGHVVRWIMKSRTLSTVSSSVLTRSVQRELVHPGSYCHVLVPAAARSQALASLLRSVHSGLSLCSSEAPSVL